MRAPLKLTINIRKLIAVAVITFLVLFINDNFFLSSNNQEYYIATTDLNVRAGAGTQYPVVFTL